jgi:hypothetical protein
VRGPEFGLFEKTLLQEIGGLNDVNRLRSDLPFRRAASPTHSTAPQRRRSPKPSCAPGATAGAERRSSGAGHGGPPRGPDAATSRASRTQITNILARLAASRLKRHAVALSANIDYIYTVDAHPYDPAHRATSPSAGRRGRCSSTATTRTLPNTPFRGWLTQALTSKRSMFGSPSSGSTSSASRHDRRLIGGVALPTQAADHPHRRRRVRRQAHLLQDATPGAAGRVKIYRHVAGAAASTRQLLLSGTFAAEPDFAKTTVTLPVSDLGLKLQGIFARAPTLAPAASTAAATSRASTSPTPWACASASRACGSIPPTDGSITAPPASTPSIRSPTARTFSRRTRATRRPPASITSTAPTGASATARPATYSYRVNFTSAFASNATKIADIVSALLTRAGYAGGDIDTAAFTALNSSRGEKVGMYCQQGETFQDVVNYLVAGAMCFLTSDPSNSGKITIGKVSAPPATAATDSSVDWRHHRPRHRAEQFQAHRHTAAALPARHQRASAIGGCSATTRSPRPPLTADKDFARQEWRTVPKVNADTPKHANALSAVRADGARDAVHRPHRGRNRWRRMEHAVHGGAADGRAHRRRSAVLAQDGRAGVDPEHVNEVNAPAIVADIDESAELERK